MKIKNYPQSIFLWALCVLFCSLPAVAQTTAINYQGRLTDGGAPANGTYEMQFKLFDLASGGSQIGATLVNSSVTVASGIFSVNLDFGSSPFAAGANRFLEIGVKKPAESSYSLLAPRQPLTSSPYSLRTLSAGSADALSATCVGCVTDAQINAVSGAKISGSVNNAVNATNAAAATVAGNVSGVVAVGNGGTGANNVAGARTNLGLGTLSVVSPTGTANATTFLRGDGSWQTLPAGNALGLAFNTTTQTNHFTINPAQNFTVYQVNRCGGGPTNVTLPTAAAAGAGRMFYVINVVPDPCSGTNIQLHVVLQGGNWIEYIGNTTFNDRTRFSLISNGVDGWLVLTP